MRVLLYEAELCAAPARRECLASVGARIGVSR